MTPNIDCYRVGAVPKQFRTQGCPVHTCRGSGSRTFCRFFTGTLPKSRYWWVKVGFRPKPNTPQFRNIELKILGSPVALFEAFASGCKARSLNPQMQLACVRTGEAAQSGNRENSKTPKLEKHTTQNLEILQPRNPKA